MATTTKDKYTYVLRTCSEDMTSRNGFKWPRKGQVKCGDWSTEPICGNGLHGLLMGSGDGSLLHWDASAQWLVVKILVQEVVAIDQKKVKFPKGIVVYCGDKKGATDYIIAHGADASKVVGAFITVGDGGVGCGGDYATVSGGDYSTVSGGYRAKVSGGDFATVSGGDYATVIGGYRAIVSGGKWAILQVLWYDGERYRVAVAYVGEDGIKAKIKYKVNDQGKFVKA